MAETKSKPAPKADYAADAAVLTDEKARAEGAQQQLQAQLEQQQKARDEGQGPLDEQEQAARAAHSAEGGGAWPEDLLLQRSLNPVGPVVSFSQQYTSHEKQDDSK